MRLVEFIFATFLILCFSKSYAISFKGETTEKLSSASDSVYVALIWHYDEGKSFSVDPAIGIVKDGRFEIEISGTPPSNGIVKLYDCEFSVAYIVLFKDRNGNKKLDFKNDTLFGVAEKNCLTFLKGDLNAALDKIAIGKGKYKNNNLRKIAQGITLTKVIKLETEEKFEFDDLVTIDRSEDRKSVV